MASSLYHRLVVLLGVFYALLSITLAASSLIPASSTFVEQGAGGGDFTVSINVPEVNDGDDLFFSMTGPAGQGWIAFGFGTQMADALIFLAYPTNDGKNITLSPRTAPGHVMPQLYANVTTTLLEGTGITNDTYIVNARCQNCRMWDGGSIDTTSTAQPMIYAIGPDSDTVDSNSESATIQQHVADGLFNMNLKAATGVAGVPIPSNSSAGNATHVQDDLSESNIANAVHALLMGGSFVIGYPLGVLMRRAFSRIWLHWLVQGATTFVVIIGAALGIYISQKNDMHPNLNSSHQIIGLAVTALVLVQLTIGVCHHRIFIKTKEASKWHLGKIHKYAGPFIILLGIINGAIGFSFAGRHGYTIVYSVIVIVIMILVATVWLLKRRRQRKREAMNSTAAQNFRHPDIPLNAYGQYGGWAPPQH